MATETDRAPAFPRNPSVETPGMTLRDYFAAKAMVALLTKLGTLLEMCSEERQQWVGEVAYLLADAMLAVRAK